MAGVVQIRLETDLTGEDYVKRQAWLDASAPECPWHGAQCKLAPHGTYGRRTPAGTLAEVEATVRAVDESPNLREAADEVRPHGVGEAAARRWLQRRALLVAACLELLRSLYPDRFAHVEPTLAAFGAVLGTQAVLVRLRDVAAAQLSALPAPLGFHSARNKAVDPKKSPRQHKTGLSPPA